MDMCLFKLETVTREQVITSKLPITYWEQYIKFNSDIISMDLLSGDTILYENRKNHTYCIQCNLCLYCEPKCPCP